MSMTLDRKTLQEIRDSAHLLAKETDDDFALEYWCALAAAADHLDAMLARNEIGATTATLHAEHCPKCGAFSMRHEWTKEEMDENVNPFAPEKEPKKFDILENILPFGRKHCPFCGSEKILAETVPNGRCFYCLDCGVRSPAQANWLEALESWNHRP
jgi:Lar family restriction alleviation protein